MVFSLGSGYLFSYVTLALIHLLEGFAGQSSTNTVSAVESSLPPVVAIVAFAVVAPGGGGIYLPSSIAGSGAYLR